MKVVIVDGDVSYPPTSGKRLRTLNLMVCLARRHTITYIARGNGDENENRKAREYLADHRIQPLIVDDPLPKKSGARFYLRLAANVVSPLPYSVASFKTPRVREAVKRFADENYADVWQFEWFPYLRFLPQAHGFRTLVIAQNVESCLWERYYRAEPHPLRRWYIKQQWRKYERFERSTLREAIRVVAVSAEDARVLRETFTLSSVDVVENGVDCKYYEPSGEARDPARILFLGSLDWRPNLDALGLLLDRIYPSVRAAEPRAHLWIVGRNPPSSLARRVASLEGVELHADVADVRPFLAKSGIMVVPLRIGGGSRLKILEALAAALPVASTRIGAEGLRLRPGEHLHVAEQAEDLVPVLLNCIRNPAAAQRMAEHGREFVRARYDWDLLANDLERSWKHCTADARSLNGNFRPQSAQREIIRPSTTGEDPLPVILPSSDEMS